MKKTKALKIMEIACDVSLALGIAPDSFSSDWISFSSIEHCNTLAHIQFNDIDGNICIFCAGNNVSREQYLMLKGIASHHGTEFGEGYFE
jgi:hypothetical protein